MIEQFNFQYGLNNLKAVYLGQKNDTIINQIWFYKDILVVCEAIDQIIEKNYNI